MSNENYHTKRVSNLGMEVMGKGQGDARKNVNKQEKGAREFAATGSSWG
jgi:hypothetical protein